MTAPDPGPLDIDPDGQRIRLLWWAVVAVLAVGLGACLVEGANRPADPILAPSEAFPDFGRATFSVVPAGAGQPTPREWCALLAEASEQHQQGLMGVTDLEGHAGMLFAFGVDRDGSFYMKGTPMPLSIAFFAADGTFVSAADMAPCPPGTAECPTYAATAPYRYALEVPQGELDDYGIGPGARLVVPGAGCTPATVDGTVPERTTP